jgi:hypothetical protein
MAMAMTIAMAQAQQAIPKPMTGTKAADSKRASRGGRGRFFCTAGAPGSMAFVADACAARQHRPAEVLAQSTVFGDDFIYLL